MKHTHCLLGRPCLALVLLLLASSASAVTIDGVFDPAEWTDAQRFDDFVSVQPLTLAPAPQDRRAEAYVLSTPEGLAVAVRAWHPPQIAQTRTRIQRDGDAPTDRMNLMIDFDADGRVGYDFTITAAGDLMDEVITNENAFRDDWDAGWGHAVADFDGGYVAEWLIPWSIAQMRDTHTPRRTVGIYFDRVIVATGERFAFPGASFVNPRFVSDFAKIEIDQYQARQLAITPYVVTSADFANRSSDFKAGFDLFYKPGGNHQFALTVNPDFGQVESDELVVNFSAIENFFNDKRPFFTENQSYFELDHALGRPFYTRRVGGTLDDGSGAADIHAAVKANGSFGRLGYGVFGASEDGEAGRDMGLLRGTYAFDRLTMGLMHSYVDRPFLRRSAEVTSADLRWRPNEQWLLRPLLMRSSSDTAGVNNSGSAAGVVVDWDMPGPFRQQYFALYADDQFELNDLGFQERNDFRYFEWETGYRQDNLPANSRYSSHSWEVEWTYRENTAGLQLSQQFALQRYSEFRGGGNLFVYVSWRDDAFDDRLTRGNGAVPIEGGLKVYVEGQRPRQGDGHLAWEWGVETFPNGVGGNSFYGYVQPRWHLNDHFDVDLGLTLWRQPEWLLWQQGRELGSFDTQRAEIYSNLNWFIGERQELRIKLQAIAIDATAKQARRLDSAGRLVDSDAPLADFQLRNLGFQVRYRYNLGPLSDFYAVYSRGGFVVDDQQRGLNDTLQDVFSLSDDDQFLLKLAYRFDL